MDRLENAYRMIPIDRLKINTFRLLNKINEYEIKNLDSIYAYKEKVGTVTISGYVQYPGKYSISSSSNPSAEKSSQ